MKKLAIDISAAQPQTNTKVNGGGEYGVFLFDLLCKENVAIEVLLSKTKGENETVSAICEKYSVTKRFFANNRELESIINGGGFDTVFFPICHPKYADLQLKKEQRVVAGVHDLSTIEQASVYRKVYGKKFFANDGKDLIRRILKYLNVGRDKQAAIEQHKKIFHLTENQISYTVSHSTKAEIVYYIKGIDPDKIKVFYTPETLISNTFPDDEMERLEKYGVEKKGYFLLCSANRWNKNNAIAIRALDTFFDKHSGSNMKVVVLGAIPYTLSYFESLVRHKERFIFKGYIDRIDMDILYKHAHAFVYPSVLEGFGLPPIETMKYGTLPLCSTAASITEVCSDAAVYFDPYSEESIYKAILKSFDKEYKRLMKGHIRRRYEEIQKKRAKDVDGVVELILDSKNA